MTEYDYNEYDDDFDYDLDDVEGLREMADDLFGGDTFYSTNAIFDEDNLAYND
jgi:hypothetical protein